MSMVLEEVEDTTAVAEAPQARWVVQGYYDPMFKKEVTSHIETLRQLPLGWDGYGAPRPTDAAVEGAKAFVLRLTDNIAPRPRVVPMASGNVQLEWVSGNRVLEFEFEDGDTVHYLRWRPNAPSDEGMLSVWNDRSVAEAMIRWFTADGR